MCIRDRSRNDFNSKREYLYYLSSPYSFSINDGEIIGKHQGSYYYTIGQRKGLDIGGFEKPLFVIETDVQNNIIYVAMGDDHPGLFKKALFVQFSDIHWLRTDLSIQENEELEVLFRVRYRQPLQKGTIFMFKEGLYILFKKSISSVTAGQFVSWYLDDELIGSGVIN